MFYTQKIITQVKLVSLPLSINMNEWVLNVQFDILYIQPEHIYFQNSNYFSFTNGFTLYSLLFMHSFHLPFIFNVQIQYRFYIRYWNITFCYFQLNSFLSHFICLFIADQSHMARYPTKIKSCFFKESTFSRMLIIVGCSVFKDLSACSRT